MDHRPYIYTRSTRDRDTSITRSFQTTSLAIDQTLDRVAEVSFKLENNPGNSRYFLRRSRIRWKGDTRITHMYRLVQAKPPKIVSATNAACNSVTRTSHISTWYQVTYWRPWTVEGDIATFFVEDTDASGENVPPPTTVLPKGQQRSHVSVGRSHSFAFLL